MVGDEIQQRMLRWALWVSRKADGASGYPSECAYTRMQQRTGGGYYSPDIDLEAAETERAVQMLDEELRLTVRVYYLKPTFRIVQAQTLHCHVRTMERRIERAHLLIAGFIDSGRGLARKKHITPT